MKIRIQHDMETNINMARGPNTNSDKFHKGYGDKDYAHAKAAKGDWTKEKEEGKTVREQEYLARLAKLDRLAKTKKAAALAEKVGDLKNVGKTYEFQKGDTLFPALKNKENGFGMNEHTAFYVMTRMLAKDINVDLIDIGDSITIRKGACAGCKAGPDRGDLVFKRNGKEPIVIEDILAPGKVEIPKTAAKRKVTPPKAEPKLKPEPVPVPLKAEGGPSVVPEENHEILPDFQVDAFKNDAGKIYGFIRTDNRYSIKRYYILDRNKKPYTNTKKEGYTDLAELNRAIDDIVMPPLKEKPAAEPARPPVAEPPPAAPVREPPMLPPFKVIPPEESAPVSPLISPEDVFALQCYEKHHNSLSGILKYKFTFLTPKPPYNATRDGHGFWINKGRALIDTMILEDDSGKKHGFLRISRDGNDAGRIYILDADSNPHKDAKKEGYTDLAELDRAISDIFTPSMEEEPAEPAAPPPPKAPEGPPPPPAPKTKEKTPAQLEKEKQAQSKRELAEILKLVRELKIAGLTFGAPRDNADKTKKVVEIKGSGKQLRKLELEIDKEAPRYVNLYLHLPIFGSREHETVTSRTLHLPEDKEMLEELIKDAMLHAPEKIKDKEHDILDALRRNPKLTPLDETFQLVEATGKDARLQYHQIIVKGDSGPPLIVGYIGIFKENPKYIVLEDTKRARIGASKGVFDNPASLAAEAADKLTWGSLEMVLGKRPPGPAWPETSLQAVPEPSPPATPVAPKEEPPLPPPPLPAEPPKEKEAEMTEPQRAAFERIHTSLDPEIWAEFGSPKNYGELAAVFKKLHYGDGSDPAKLEATAEKTVKPLFFVYKDKKNRLEINTTDRHYYADLGREEGESQLRQLADAEQKTEEAWVYIEYQKDGRAYTRWFETGVNEQSASESGAVLKASNLFYIVPRLLVLQGAQISNFSLYHIHPRVNGTFARTPSPFDYGENILVPYKKYGYRGAFDNRVVTPEGRFTITIDPENKAYSQSMDAVQKDFESTLLQGLDPVEYAKRHSGSGLKIEFTPFEKTPEAASRPTPQAADPGEEPPLPPADELFAPEAEKPTEDRIRAILTSTDPAELLPTFETLLKTELYKKLGAKIEGTPPQVYFYFKSESRPDIQCKLTLARNNTVLVNFTFPLPPPFKNDVRDSFIIVDTLNLAGFEEYLISVFNEYQEKESETLKTIRAQLTATVPGGAETFDFLIKEAKPLYERIFKTKSSLLDPVTKLSYECDGFSGEIFIEARNRIALQIDYFTKEKDRGSKGSFRIELNLSRFDDRNPAIIDGRIRAELANLKKKYPVLLPAP